MLDVEFHPVARDDYRDASVWYRARSHRAAERSEAEVEHLIGLVAATPMMFPLYDDEHRFAMLRRFLYSVVYQVQPGRNYVVAVAHSRRSPAYWRGRS